MISPRTGERKGEIMPKILLKALLLLCLFAGSAARASDAGTPDEAKAMALHAAAFLQDNGPATAFPVFDAPGGPFHDRDLYVMVYDSSGTNVAHGANKALIGKNLIDLKDTDGVYVIRGIVAVKTQGWVDYKWPNPLTKKLAPKTTYVVRVGEYLIGVGAYK